MATDTARNYSSGSRLP